MPYSPALGFLELVLLAATVPLGLLTIPLAVRTARPALWWVHTLLGLALAVGLTMALDRLLLAGAVPWWKLLVVYSVGCVVLPLGTAWSARWAACRWPPRRWSMTSLAVLLGVAVSGVAAVRVSYALLPGIDLVQAVK
ncbi:hypothetical protein [Gemmatimonas sp.]|uniref:hypothetical protein n=1 Tax=Gemmatimonas sp. TaxID=1962908 RepID=UPI00286CC732|nr:hypothetical protein [Gemmatimonas sp.]